MKKLALIIVTAVVLLGFASCKKEKQLTVAPQVQVHYIYFLPFSWSWTHTMA